MAVLICKDTPVYDIGSNKILNPKLIPFQFESRRDFENWKRRRAFLQENRSAEYTASLLPPDDPGLKRRMSLSDCYWIKYPKDTTSFFDITPYLRPFTSLSSVVRNSSVPDQNLGGSVMKNWTVLPDGRRAMLKNMREDWVQNELLSVALAQKLSIPCAPVFQGNTRNLLYIPNISGISQMLLTFRELGVKCNGYSPGSISGAYRQLGDSDTESYALQTVLFDFNLAHRETPHYFLGAVAANLNQERLVDIAAGILKMWQPVVIQHGVAQWRANLAELLERLQ